MRRVCQWLPRARRAARDRYARRAEEPRRGCDTSISNCGRYPELAALLAATLHAAYEPTAVVGATVPWSPDAIDGRAYDDSPRPCCAAARVAVRVPTAVTRRRTRGRTSRAQPSLGAASMSMSMSVSVSLSVSVLVLASLLSLLSLCCCCRRSCRCCCCVDIVVVLVVLSPRRSPWRRETFGDGGPPRGPPLDGCRYDFASLGRAVDAVFVMAYCLQSQVLSLPPLDRTWRNRRLVLPPRAASPPRATEQLTSASTSADARARVPPPPPPPFDAVARQVFNRCVAGGNALPMVAHGARRFLEVTSWDAAAAQHEDRVALNQSRGATTVERAALLRLLRLLLGARGIRDGRGASGLFSLHDGGGEW